MVPEDRYPQGFESPEMAAIVKKHKMEKLAAMAKDGFAKERFSDVPAVLESMRRLVSSSTMVSVFEKPKFRDLLKDLSADEQQALAGGLEQMLHTAISSRGFEQMSAVLLPYKLAKWTLLTVFLICYSPYDEVFIKPTTAKNVIEHFELEGLVYSPKVNYEFYRAYRGRILEMKAAVDQRLQVDNGAFGGFLFMSLQD